MNKKINIAIFSSWDNSKLYYLLDELYKNDLNVQALILDGVISEKAKQIHLERTKEFFQALDFFDIEKFSCPIYLVKNHNDSNCCALLRKLKVDLVLNGGTPRILKSEIFSVPRIGILNCHPGILPKYRGCTCVEWSIYNDDEVGATCHFMTEKIDAGPIVCSEEMKVNAGDLYEKVRANMIFHQYKVMVKGIKRIITEGLNPNLMKTQDESLAQYHKVIPEDKLDVVKYKLKNRTYKYLNLV